MRARPDRRVLWGVVGIAAIAIAIALGLGTTLSSGSAHAAAATVPSVVGDHAAVATRRLATHGLHAVELGQFSSQPAGVVLSQDLHSGLRVDAGATVTLTVSKGAAHSVMPNLTGARAAAAAARLRSLRLAVLRFTVASAAPVGTVVSTYPPRGSVLGYDAVARLNVSGGLPAGSPRSARVPRLVGAREAAAQASLRARGLTPVVYYLRSTRGLRVVTRQTQRANTVVPLGTLVGIGVSLGPAGVAATPVPYVVGRARAAGTSLLRSTGFRVHVVTRRPAVRTTSGTVLDEQPMGGTKAPAHAVVTLVIAA